ncbi:hypothetical protein ACP70R_001509 [Stipagrostis hirtigluma subsp. patula]
MAKDHRMIGSNKKPTFGALELRNRANTCYGVTPGHSDRGYAVEEHEVGGGGSFNMPRMCDLMKAKMTSLTGSRRREDVDLAHEFDAAVLAETVKMNRCTSRIIQKQVDFAERFGQILAAEERVRQQSIETEASDEDVASLSGGDVGIGGDQVSGGAERSPKEAHVEYGPRDISAGNASPAMPAAASNDHGLPSGTARDGGDQRDISTGNASSAMPDDAVTSVQNYNDDGHQGVELTFAPTAFQGLKCRKRTVTGPVKGTSNHFDSSGRHDGTSPTVAYGNAAVDASKAEGPTVGGDNVMDAATAVCDSVEVAPGETVEGSLADQTANRADSDSVCGDTARAEVSESCGFSALSDIIPEYHDSQQDKLASKERHVQNPDLNLDHDGNTEGNIGGEEGERQADAVQADALNNIINRLQIDSAFNDDLPLCCVDSQQPASCDGTEDVVPAMQEELYIVDECHREAVEPCVVRTKGVEEAKKVEVKLLPPKVKKNKEQGDTVQGVQSGAKRLPKPNSKYSCPVNPWSIQASAGSEVTLPLWDMLLSPSSPFDRCASSLSDCQYGLAVENGWMHIFIDFLRYDDSMHRKDWWNDRLLLEPAVAYLLNVENFKTLHDPNPTFSEERLVEKLADQMPLGIRLKDVKYIILPVLHKEHFTVYVINLKQTAIHVLDSLDYESRQSKFKDHHNLPKECMGKRVVDRLSDAIQKLYKGSVPMFKHWRRGLFETMLMKKPNDCA